MLNDENRVNNIKTEESLIKLKKASLKGNVVKGLKETIRLIESGRAKTVFCAKSDDNENYLNVIKQICLLYKIELIELDDWLILRDILINTTPSEEVKAKARRLGKEAKIKPKCNCAAIIEKEKKLVNKLII
jgi:hypothetical protein